jgi:hypothetical protein
MERKMEQIGKLLSNHGLTSQPNTRDSREISLQSEPSMGLDQLVQQLRERGAPEWEIAVIAMAQDKRHDLPEITLESWREKLKSYSDGEVCEALSLWAGEFFPSVDDIAKAIHRMRENRAVNKPWEQYKANQAKAAAEGRLATDEDYERLRADCREIMARAPVITAEGRPHAKAPDKQESVQSHAGDTGPDSMAGRQSNDSGS